MSPRRHGRLYRCLLLVYPRAHRGRFGDEMAAAFEAAIADALESGGRKAVLLLWLGALKDLVLFGLAERWRRNRPPLPTDARGNPLPFSHALQLARDTRFAARQLVREPAMAAVTVLALGLGIGLTATAFSIVYGSVWRGLPFQEPDRLVHFERRQLGDDSSSLAVSHHDYAAWRQQQTSFEDLGAFVEALVHLTGDGGPAERRYGVFISPASFSLLRVGPQLGRLIDEADARPGAQPVVLVGDGFWRERYGGDPTVIGRSIRLNGVDTQIIGVMPQRFGFPVSESLWLPLRIDLDAVERGGGRLDVFGRLAPGRGLDDARAEMELISRRLAASHPENRGIAASLQTFREEYLGDGFLRQMYTLLAGAVLVLFVACANVANLLLARTARRGRELALRTALGARRAGVVSQLLVETLLLSLIGGALGLALAHLGVSWFASAWIDQGAVDLPHGPAALFWWDFSIDLVPTLFVLAITFSAALLAGTLPALRGASADVAPALKDEGQGASGLGAGRLARSLVIAEVALSTALLVAAGLTVESVLNTTRVGAGVESEGVVTARMSLPDRRLGMSDSRYADPASRLSFWSRLSERLEGAPGVEAGAVTTALPLTRSGSARLQIEGRDVAGGDELPQVRSAVVSSGFFATFGVAALSGRLFDRRDRRGGEPVVIVNRSFEERFFPGGRALHQRVRLEGPGPGLEEPWLQIVGVVPDLWMDGERNRRPEGLYLPLEQSLVGSTLSRLGPWGLTFMSVAVRASGPADRGGEVARAAVAALDPTVPVYGLQPMEELVARTVGRYRVYGLFYLVLAVMALVLALIGLYSVVSYSVVGRTREIGVRLALGARKGRVVRSVVLQGLLWVLAGLILGVGLARWLGAGLERVLYRVEPWDPMVFTMIGGLFLVTGAVAAWIPARRVAGIDPAEALRAG